MQTLPPGKYFIGDPGYVLEDSWGEVVDAIEQAEGKVFSVRGVKMWAHYTAHGDGEFTDQHGNTFAVDSGTLGAVPIELIEDPAGEEYGVVIDAEHGLTVDYDNGTFWLGATVIKTDDIDASGFADEDDDLYELDADENWF